MEDTHQDPLKGQSNLLQQRKM